MSTAAAHITKPESAADEHARKINYIRSLQSPETKLYKRLRRIDRTDWVTCESMLAMAIMATMDMGIGRIPGMDAALVAYLVEERYLARCPLRGYKWLRKSPRLCDAS